MASLKFSGFEISAERHDLPLLQQTDKHIGLFESLEAAVKEQDHENAQNGYRSQHWTLQVVVKVEWLQRINLVRLRFRVAAAMQPELPPVGC